MEDIIERPLYHSPNIIPQKNLLTEYPTLPQTSEKLSITVPSNTPLPCPTLKQQKRGPSILNSSISNASDKEQQTNLKTNNSSPIKLVQLNTNPPVSQTKRLKTVEKAKPPLILSQDEISQIKNQFESIKSNNPIQCQFTATDFIDSLPTIRHRKDKIESAKSFTSDLPSLLFVLDEIKPFVSTGTKKTITSLIKVIRGCSLSLSDTE